MLFSFDKDLEGLVTKNIELQYH